MVIKVGQHTISKYESVTVSLRYDSIADTFSFVVYYDIDNAVDRAIFKPGTYQKCTISHTNANGQNELLITGVILSHSMASSAKKELSSLSGGSVTGILAECCIFAGTVNGNVVAPGDASAAVQNDGETLRSLTNKIIAKYGFGECVVDKNVTDECDKVFPQTTASLTETVEAYLSTLAAQRNVVLTHTTDGRVLYTRCRAEKVTTNTISLERTDVLSSQRLDVYNDPGTILVINHNSSTYSAPVYSFAPGQALWTKMSLNYNGQNMHSYIQAVGQQGEDINPTNSPDGHIENAYVQNTFRYMRVIQTSGDDNDTINVAQNQRSNDLKNLTLTIEMVGWTLGGKLIRPNQIIMVKNPEVHLYKNTRWFIESVTFTGDAKSETCVLNCVVPETYNDEDIVNVFE